MVVLPGRGVLRVPVKAILLHLGQAAKRVILVKRSVLAAIGLLVFVSKYILDVTEPSYCLSMNAETISSLAISADYRLNDLAKVYFSFE